MNFLVSYGWSYLFKLLIVVLDAFYELRVSKDEIDYEENFNFFRKLKNFHLDKEIEWMELIGKTFLLEVDVKSLKRLLRII